MDSWYWCRERFHGISRGTSVAANLHCSSLLGRHHLCHSLSLSSLPIEQAVWVTLSTTVAMVEEEYARFGPDRDEFKAAMVNLARYCPMLSRWLNAKSSGQPTTKLRECAKL